MQTPSSNASSRVFRLLRPAARRFSGSERWCSECPEGSAVRLAGKTASFHDDEAELGRWLTTADSSDNHLPPFEECG